MKQTTFILFIVLSFHFMNAQTRGVTEDGDEVILYDDGTWVYVDESILSEEKIIITNETKFEKDKKATFKLKSKITDVGVWIDPKKWKFVKGAVNGDAEFEFQKKGDDLYGMLISEQLEIPVETLREIAFENARSVAPDLKIIKEEYRNVNGIDVFMMQMVGTIQGIRFVYFGYYYSNESGTVQLLAYTGEQLFEEYQEEMETFLNGFVVLE